MFIYFERERERERERTHAREWGRRTERERGRERIPSRVHTILQSPRQGSNSRPWDHDLSRNQESDTQPAETPRHHITNFLLEYICEHLASNSVLYHTEIIAFLFWNLSYTRDIDNSQGVSKVTHYKKKRLPSSLRQPWSNDALGFSFSGKQIGIDISNIFNADLVLSSISLLK